MQLAICRAARWLEHAYRLTSHTLHNTRSPHKQATDTHTQHSTWRAAQCSMLKVARPARLATSTAPLPLAHMSALPCPALLSALRGQPLPLPCALLPLVKEPAGQGNPGRRLRGSGHGRSAWQTERYARLVSGCTGCELLHCWHRLYRGCMHGSQQHAQAVAQRRQVTAPGAPECTWPLLQHGRSSCSTIMAS